MDLDRAVVRNARVEVGVQDPALGEVRLQALMDRSGAMHIALAGRTQGAEALLEQITPLLHAAVVQQADAHGAARAVHVSTAALFSERDTALEPLTGRSVAAAPQGSNLAFSLSDDRQQPQQQQRRQFPDLRSVRPAGAEPEFLPIPVTTTPGLSMSGSPGSSGLSVRI